MSSFMQEYYQTCIFPQTIKIPEGEYLPYIEDIFAHLPEDHMGSLMKWEEFISIHAFLLGFRTAAGLSAAMAFTETTGPDGPKQQL